MRLNIIKLAANSFLINGISPRDYKEYKIMKHKPIYMYIIHTTSTRFIPLLREGFAAVTYSSTLFQYFCAPNSTTMMRGGQAVIAMKPAT